MKKQLLILLLALTTQIICTQDKKVDSINTILDAHKTRDSLRVENLLSAKDYHIYRDLDKTFEIINEALIISKEIRYLDGEASSLIALGEYYKLKGEFDIALETVLKAREIIVDLADNEKLILTNSQIAVLYQKTEKYEKALEILFDIIELMKHKPSSSLKARFYFNIANTYHNLENYKKTEFYFKEALKIATEAKDEVGAALINGSLGNLYKDLGKYKDAVNKLTNTLGFFKKINNNAGVAGSYFALAQSYRGLNKIDLAIENNAKAIEFYENQNRFYLLKESYKNQADLYDLKQKHQKSNEYLKKYYTVVDSIFNKEKTKAIEEMQVKYETEKTKREKETAEQQVIITKLESKKNRNLFLGSLLMAALLAVSAIFYFSRLKAKRKAELITLELKETQKRLALEKQFKDSELKALKAQMNPHFIFNALNSIQDYIVLNQKNLASDYLGKFADLIRNYLHFSDTGFISVPDEIHNLNLYLELEKLRFEEQLQYSFTVDDAVNIESIKIPTMLIQPYIENALKHGLLHRKKARKLSVSIYKVSDKIIACVIEDNGIGREKSKEINAKKEHQHKSFATNATSQRLELLNFGKESKIGVEIIDLKDNYKALGTKVILKIPIIK
tara:strand:+ start:32738 stop:34597 length:1860 start_codon:yes stop_codon:yes gene_type:complete